MVSARVASFPRTRRLECFCAVGLRHGELPYLWLCLCTDRFTAFERGKRNHLRHVWFHDGPPGPYRHDSFCGLAAADHLVARDVASKVQPDLADDWFSCRSMLRACRAPTDRRIHAGAQCYVCCNLRLDGARRTATLLSCFTGVVLLGLGLAALQILPTLELSRFSTRADYGFSEFVSYSLPLKHILLILFPGVFGGLSRYGATPYFGEWNLTETSGYLGLLSLLLAPFGLAASHLKRFAIFWLCVAVLSFLLALGDQTPLAYLAYYLPVIGKFRAPARHLIEMAFAVSVLAGIGMDAILRGKVTTRLLVKTVVIGGIIMSIGVLLLLSRQMSQYALAKGVADLKAYPWSNAAVGIPIAVFITGVAGLLYWHSQPHSQLRQVLLLLILVLDLASFGWFYNWHDSPQSKEVLNEPASANTYRQLLHDTNQRILSVRGTLGSTSELPPNLSRLWNIPNATGYSPLTLSRVTDLLSLLPDASVAPRWKEPGDQSLNLAAVRYVFLPRPEYLEDARGILWEKENMDNWLGSGCDHPPANSLKFDLSKPVRATKIGIVSRLACSTSLPDGEEVARVLVTDSTGAVQTKRIVAGRDTSEWAYDCPGVTPHMKHGKAQIFSSFAAAMYDKPCEGHFYLTQVGLDGPKEIRKIEIQWAGRSGAITIEKISLIDEPAKITVPINSLAKADGQWRFIEQAGEAHVYENLHSRPRAWLVSESVVLESFEILKAIKTSLLPDGRIFNPSQMVLVEESVPADSDLMSQTPDQTASARVERLSSSAMEVRTSSRSGSFLVTSDTFYPGWQATVDGAPVRIVRANYALRGVAVSAGDHLVRFEFRPKSFYAGAAISALSLLLLGGILVFAFPKFAGRVYQEGYQQGYQVDTDKDAHLT